MASFVLMDTSRDHKIQKEEFTAYVHAADESHGREFNEDVHSFTLYYFDKKMDKDHVCYTQFIIVISVFVSN